jgi:AcrR family transcriptional regulator
LPAAEHTESGDAPAEGEVPSQVDVSDHPTARRMIAAARRILSRDGFSALTLEAVSAEAEVNKAATRYYFGGKQGLVEAVIREIVLDECADARAPAIPNATPAKRVDAFIARTRRVATDAESFSGFFEVLPQVRKSDATKREFMQLYEQWFAWNVEWLGLAGSDLSLETRRGLGMLMAAVVDGLAVQETIFEPAYDPEHCLSLFRQVLMDLVEGLSRADITPPP